MMTMQQLLLSQCFNIYRGTSMTKKQGMTRVKGISASSVLLGLLVIM
jgi:hypothetical protein